MTMHCASLVSYKAVVIHPVIEMNNSFPAVPADVCISPGPINKNCQRSHQALYNEIVEVLEEKDDAIKISLKNITYKTNGAVSTFWTHKANVLALDAIVDHTIICAIPQEEYGEQPTIILTYPWKNFSVGTRFTYMPENDSEGLYAVIIPDYVHNTTCMHMIPCKHAIVEVQQSPADARQLFVTIINNLVDKIEHDDPGHVIPYVWGGSSFVHPYQETDYYLDDTGLYQRKSRNGVYSGYDCSEFVIRMAKIAGLDFPWKTTAAIQHGQRALNQDEALQDGDLIWINGHVMIISNLEKNELIEARGYNAGFGCVHRIKLSDMFEDVETYDDLLVRYHAHMPLNFKNKQGDLYLKADKFLLLKLIN